MNDNQNAKLNMFQAVSDTCHENEKIYANTPICVDVVSELDQAISDIRKVEQEQMTTKVQGVSQEKNNWEDKLVTLSIKTANVLYVYAFSTNQPILLAKVHVNKSTFFRLENNEELSLAKTLLQEARDLGSTLDAYGMPRELPEQLEEAIIKYGEWIERPRDTIAEHKTHTTTLKRFFAATDSILYDKLDKLMRLFKEDYPDFYNNYRTVRNIINTSVRHKKEA
jgi:hypothetical protein